MAMRWHRAVALAGLLGAVGLVTGCEERQGAREDAQPGVGGAGAGQEREGLDIGEEPGVLRDGEAPLGGGDTQPGQAPGVLNDGEGPVEERSGRGGAGGVGPLESEQMQPGEAEGVRNDGEGPVERR